MASMIDVALDLFDAGFNVMITAAGVGVMTDEEVAALIEQGDE